MASAAAFVEQFRELHERAKRGVLGPQERVEYVVQREQLGRLLLAAQHSSHGGRTLRHALRIAQLVKVDIDLGGPKPERTSTLDLAGGGFAAILPSAVAVGREVGFSLFLPAVGTMQPPVSGSARVASCRAKGTSFRVSFAFDVLKGTGREHLEMVIIDAVLARFTQPG